MRVVLDTNVLISGIFFSGPPAKILSHWRKGDFIAVISEPIILEYTRVAEKISQEFPQVEIAEILRLFILNSEIVDTGGLEIRECEGLADNKFLECAVAVGCEVIVSGDKHLLKMSEYRGVKILKPGDLLDKYLGSKG